MFYRKNEDGSIMDYSSESYSPNCLFTEKEIVKAWNGLVYIEGEEPQEPELPVEVIQARIQKQLTNAVQRVLDSKAQELLYDNCLSVCSYIDTGVQKFDDESRAFRKWRSAVWSKCYEILDLVKSGEREIPSEEELIAELPELVIEYGVK